MQFHTPKTFEAAVAIAAQASGKTRFLAGGTDVLVQLRAGMVTPDDLIDLKHIAGVKDIEPTPEGGWRIGIAVSGAELGRHAGVVADWPGIVEGMQLVGSTQVQGRATLVGNLCNGSPAADSVPAMVTAGAKVTVIGPKGNREIAVEDVPAGPGRNVLQPGEVITAIILPPRGKNGGDAYLRFIPRSEMDIAVVGAAVNLRLQGDKITEARVALGAVAAKVMLVPAAAQAIIGTTLDAAALEAMATAAVAAATPISDKRGTAAFRKDIVGVLVKRAARIALERAKGAQK
jgi:carbon-monoxide dehydrogenase medium subunit